jgi:hypothetical protein
MSMMNTHMLISIGVIGLITLMAGGDQPWVKGTLIYERFKLRNRE